MTTGNTPPESQTPPESHEAFIQRTRSELDALKAEMEKVAKESGDIKADSPDEAMKLKAKELAARAEALHRKFDEKIEQLRMRFPSQESLLKATDSLRTSIDSILGNTQIGPLKGALEKLNTKITDKNETGTTGMTLSERVEAVKNALPEKPVTPSPSPGTEAKPEAEAEDTPKTTMDRLMGGVEKFMEVFEKFMKTLQGYGSKMLLMLSKAADAVGWKDISKKLEELAGGDHAVLVDALKDNGASIKKLKKPKEGDNPQLFQAQMNEYQEQAGKMEAPQTALANRYQELASTDKRGTAYTRQKFYAEVVGKWRKENPTAKECGAAELERMAVIAMDKKLVPDMDGQPKNLPAAAPDKPENYPTLEALAETNTANLMNENKINIENKIVTVRVLQNGTLQIITDGKTINRHIALKVDPQNKKDGENVTLTIIAATLNKTNLVIGYQQQYKDKSDKPITAGDSKEVKVPVLNTYLVGVVKGTITGDYEIADFRFKA